MIPVVDTLQNVVKQMNHRENAFVNALCERLLNSLEGRFGYLLDSAIHKAATALDPRIKLSFVT